MRGKYDDILELPHPVSDKHPPMPMADRAAQFAPFAALTGHDAVLRETERLTDSPVELTDSRRSELDAQLISLSQELDRMPKVAITHFVPDTRKSGGAYIRTVGCIRRVDAVARAVIMADGSGIDMDFVTDIQKL